MKQNNTIHVRAESISNGIVIFVDGKDYKIEYPQHIWQALPSSLQKVLCDNLAFSSTQALPMMMGKDSISYDFSVPLLECFFFENQLYDMTNSEKADNAPHLEYVRRFYNAQYNFDDGDSAMVDISQIPHFSDSKPSAILPFTFGKESLATVGLCRELGIEPIVVYCQELAHPYEDAYKKKKLHEFTQKFGVPHYYLSNEPGKFRYGLAFNLEFPTELGWGTQTTVLALLMLPFVYFHQSRYIFFGNEISCNEYEFIEGWKMYAAGFDQTTQWTKQQNNMIRLLTNSQCQVKSSLESLDEINIFYLLHHRYPELSPYQFSCSGVDPLYEDTQWCHTCYKCTRMYLFATCCGIDPTRIGFKKDLLHTPGLFENYFGTEYKTGSMQELDFSFYILHQKKVDSPYVQKFAKEKLPQFQKDWNWYRKYYHNIKHAKNLPQNYQKRMVQIFQQELDAFDANLGK